MEKVTAKGAFHILRVDNHAMTIHPIRGKEEQVDVKMVSHIAGELSSYRDRVSNQAAAHTVSAVACLLQTHGGIQTIGQHRQIQIGSHMSDHAGSRGGGVQKDHASRLEQLCSPAADAVLSCGVDGFSKVQRQIGLLCGHRHGTALSPDDEFLVFQLPQVPVGGGKADVKTAAEFFHREKALPIQELPDLLKPFIPLYHN